MSSTLMTVKSSELGDTLDRIGRRWAGSMIDLAVRPQTNGLVVITVGLPAGVEEPPDPGPSPLQLELIATQDTLRATAGANATLQHELEFTRSELDTLRSQLNAEREQHAQSLAQAHDQAV